jgi:hypothetical protein
VVVIDGHGRSHKKTFKINLLVFAECQANSLLLLKFVIEQPSNPLHQPVTTTIFKNRPCSFSTNWQVSEL